MEMTDQVIGYWRNQNITIEAKSHEQIGKILCNSNILLPLDFIDFYQKANGMINLFPNDYDREGFLFYPIEELITMEMEFRNKSIYNLKNVIIFADYLLKCWWYGVRIKEDGSYEIGLISDHISFNFITKSLNDFLNYILKIRKNYILNPTSPDRG